MEKKTPGRKTTTQGLEIIEHLKNGASMNSLVKMGYHKSTVLYNKKKLFEPEKFEKLMVQVNTSNKKYKASKLVKVA